MVGMTKGGKVCASQVRDCYLKLQTTVSMVLTAVKKAEDANGLILRVYEWAGKESTVELHVPQGATGATVTNLMEKPEGDALKLEGDVVKAPIKPYEILTIRVDYPGNK